MELFYRVLNVFARRGKRLSGKSPRVLVAGAVVGPGSGVVER